MRVYILTEEAESEGVEFETTIYGVYATNEMAQKHRPKDREGVYYKVWSYKVVEDDDNREVREME